MIRIEPVSETCLMIYFGDQIDPLLTQRIAQVSHAIEQGFSDQVIEVIPSYTSILIQYHPLKISFNALQSKILNWIAQQDHQLPVRAGKTITLPVYYDPEVGPDLLSVAQCHGLTPRQVIERHSQQSYTVCAIGFAPGFAFLASVDTAIATARHKEPRVNIPAGSVGIADRQTAVYPDDSPGGWQIIGNCPQSLFSPAASPMTPFEVGDRVQFESIDRNVFLQQGGVIWPHWK